MKVSKEDDVATCLGKQFQWQVAGLREKRMSISVASTKL